MTQGRSFHLVPLLACLGILAGCGEGGRTPTSPEPIAAASAAQLAAPAAETQPQGGPTAVVAAASRGGGLPRRHRDDSTPERRGANPHHGGGSSGGGAPGEVQLSLEIQPDTWNVDFSHTPGTVSALLGGTGLDAVDRGSIVLAGTAGTARPLSVRRAGDRLEAIFADADAIGTLDHPIRGERQRVTLRLKAGGAAQALDAFVHIVGESAY